MPRPLSFANRVMGKNVNYLLARSVSEVVCPSPSAFFAYYLELSLQGRLLATLRRPL